MPRSWTGYGTGRSASHSWHSVANSASAHVPARAVWPNAVPFLMARPHPPVAGHLAGAVRGVVAETAVVGVAVALGREEVALVAEGALDDRDVGFFARLQIAKVFVAGVAACDDPVGYGFGAVGRGRVGGRAGVGELFDVVPFRVRATDEIREPVFIGLAGRDDVGRSFMVLTSQGGVLLLREFGKRPAQSARATSAGARWFMTARFVGAKTIRITKHIPPQLVGCSQVTGRLRGGRLFPLRSPDARCSSRCGSASRARPLPRCRRRKRRRPQGRRARPSRARRRSIAAGSVIGVAQRFADAANRVGRGQSR